MFFTFNYILVFFIFKLLKILFNYQHNVINFLKYNLGKMER